MLPYPPATVSIKQFSLTDCTTIWVSLVVSLIDFHHIFLVEFKLALFARLHLFQHTVGILPSCTRISVGSYLFSFSTLSLCLSTGSDHHYIFHHSNADDSKLQNTATPSRLPGLTDSIRVYTDHYYKGRHE